MKTIKEITKEVRDTLKKKYPDFKFSIRFKGRMIYIVILRTPFRFLKRFEEISDFDLLKIKERLNKQDPEKWVKDYLSRSEIQINDNHLENEWELTDRAKEVIKEISKISNQDNWDRSEPMFDHFDFNYIADISLGDYEHPFQDKKNEVKRA